MATDRLKKDNTTTTKEVNPVLRRTKQSISAASIFKKNPQKVTKASTTPHADVNISKVKDRSASVHKPPQITKHSRGKTADVHPLAAAFKGIPGSNTSVKSLLTTQDTKNEYCAHLCNRTTAKLDDTLETLLAALHNSTLAASSSPPNSSDPSTSHVKMTMSAKYNRAAEKLFQPISQYTVTSRTTNENGDTALVQQTLLEKLTSFEERYQKDIEEIKILEAQWEKVVGEIWKVGVTCLGDDAMRSMLLEDPEPSTPQVRDTDQEFLLSVPEHSPPNRETKHIKKRVSFQTPRPELPKFLYAPSSSKGNALPRLPRVPSEEAKRLDDMVIKLGAEQIEEFRKIDAEQQKWWNKKTQQIAMTLKDD